MLDYTDLTSAQRSNIPSGQTSCRPMHSIWTLDIGRETIGNKTLQRRANVEPISRANVDTMSKMTTGQRWHSIQLRPHHFWTYTSNLTTVVNSILKFMISVIFIWETGYLTRAIKRFALFDLLKSLYSDTNILSKYIPSLQKKL